MPQISNNGVLTPQTKAFYQRAMHVLNEAGVPFLVGGAYALNCYAGIERHTRDFDIFVKKTDSAHALDVLAAVGYDTELTFPHWLGKAYNSQKEYIDVIFSSGNGVAVVDDLWFQNAVHGTVLDVPAWLCPAEEIIWSKSFIMERERFDGADIAHIIHARGPMLNWEHLLNRFGADHWRILFTHLVLFGFIYPEEKTKIPAWVMASLMEKLSGELKPASGDDNGNGRRAWNKEQCTNVVNHDGTCQGTLLSRQQYLVDLDKWGYRDARVVPLGNMTPEETAIWTDAIGR